MCAFSQDQVDTLTFQNQSLRDKAKRFEEALRRSTDEQIVVNEYPAYIYKERKQKLGILLRHWVPFIQTLPFIHLFLNALVLWQDALAPYQHIEQDLKSLKEVVEMKNQQIHQQEKKISDLEKVVGSNKPP